MTKPAASALLSMFEPSVQQIDRMRMSLMLRSARPKVEILVADAHEGERNLLQDILRKDIFPHNTCKVYMATNAKEAWSNYLSYAPDLVFIGVDLPEIEGYKLARLIRTVDASAFYVMVTPKASERDSTRVVECGAKGLLVKPYDQQKMLNITQRFKQESAVKK